MIHKIVRIPEVKDPVIFIIDFW